MEWLKIIIPLLGVLIGWGLSEMTGFFSNKRQDKRKLKRLIFFLLELRFHFHRELIAKNQINVILNNTLIKLRNKIPDMPDLDTTVYKPLITEIFKKMFADKNQLKFLEENIDSVIIDLSEIYPVFAYELNGQHKIKERLKEVEDCLEEFSSVLEEQSLNLKDWLEPKLTLELMKDLDFNIIKIAAKIGYKTVRAAKRKIKKIDQINVNSTNVESFLSDFIETTRVVSG